MVSVGLRLAHYHLNGKGNSMYELTRLEAEFVLNVLNELKSEESELFEEEHDQAIEIIERLLQHE